MRILVTGANGQVGHELLRALAGFAPAPNLHRARPATPDQNHFGGRRFSEREKEVAQNQCGKNPYPAGRGAGVRVRPCTIIPATRDGVLENGAACEAIDLADLEQLPLALDRIQPDVIVNAAACTAVDRAEEEPDLARRINGDAIGVLGTWAARRGTRVVHYSTDYVFDGSATRPYREDDPTHPLGAYGRSKLAGEIALRESGARHLLLRTAWVYAARGHNFLRTMLRLGVERDELRVVDDQIGAPTPAGLIADVTALALARWYADDAAAAADGVYHLAAASQTSWCGFARAIFARCGVLPGHRDPPRVIATGTADYPTPARRPAYSVLATTKLRESFGVVLPDWQTALDGVIAELT
jgi:dTDP-4-dehydrorhamnose reductase